MTSCILILSCSLASIIKRFATHSVFCCTLLICVLLYGCATVGVPSGSEAEAIRTGEKSVVMMRLEGKVNGQSVNSVKHFGLKFASIDRNEAPHYIFSRSSPSSDRRREGWIYLLLNPGETYYLSSSLGVRRSETQPFHLTPDIMFHVPKDKLFVYIGSLSVSCEGKVNFFGVPYVDSCTDLSITDETESYTSGKAGGLNV